MARAVIIVLDGVGIGELPDAARFGDVGAHTLGSLYSYTGGELKIPNLYSMGLGNIENARLKGVKEPNACFGKCAEKSPGKDTTGGHWEIAGLTLKEPFKTYPDGFPKDIMEKLRECTGHDFIGNYPASGTEIIKSLGERHMESGAIIIYTSADSVMQLAAHERVIPLNELYRVCEIARGIMRGDNLVGRIIARPFTGGAGAFVRTQDRKDYSVEPPYDSILDAISGAGMEVCAVGKIEDIFSKRGITRSNHTHSNEEGIDATIAAVKENFNGILFTNLVDFDMLYGHRNDIPGFVKALEYFDSRLPEIMDALYDGDLLFITADHGCDPAASGTDHTREYIPLIVYGKAKKGGERLGVRESFADIGATVIEYLGLPKWHEGESFLNIIK